MCVSVSSFYSATNSFKSETDVCTVASLHCYDPLRHQGLKKTFCTVHICHTNMFQIINNILILDKDNLRKNKNTVFKW